MFCLQSAKKVKLPNNSGKIYLPLTLKAPITTAADNILNFFFFFFYFSKKTSLDISCEPSAWQTVHMKYHDMKYQDLFFWKIKKNKNKCRLLQIFLGALRVKLSLIVI